MRSRRFYICVMVLTSLAAFVAGAVVTTKAREAILPCVRANRFELVDASGQARAILRVDRWGAGLELLDPAGLKRAQFLARANGSELALVEGNLLRGRFAAYGSGGTELEVFGAGAKVRLFGSPTGEAGLELYNSGREADGTFIVKRDQTSQLRIIAPDGGDAWQAP